MLPNFCTFYLVDFIFLKSVCMSCEIMFEYHTSKKMEGPYSIEPVNMCSYPTVKTPHDVGIENILGLYGGKCLDIEIMASNRPHAQM